MGWDGVEWGWGWKQGPSFKTGLISVGAVTKRRDLVSREWYQAAEEGATPQMATWEVKVAHEEKLLPQLLVQARG